VEEPVLATTQGQLEDAVRAGRAVVTEDALLLARSEQLDAFIDVTGSVEFGAQVVMEAFRHGKHVV
jgi:predicted homoserine dehydrogenase-like protein